MSQTVSPADEGVAGDLETGHGSAQNGEPGYALDPWSLTFRDKALETEYLASHMTLMRTAPRVYAIPLFTMFSAFLVTLLTILYEHDEREMPTAMLLGVIFSPGACAGLVTQRKFGGRGFPLFLRAVQITEAAFLVAAAWNPFYQRMTGACASDVLVANCGLINQGTAPYPALLVVAVTPMILSVVYGMHWLPVVAIFIATNGVAVYYILAYQLLEADSCMVTFILATALSLSVSWVVTRQERETFVWRKVALSETRVELERTVMCRVVFAVCELIACFHSSMRSCVTKFGIRLR